jgi:uncharacterized protein
MKRIIPLLAVGAAAGWLFDLLHIPVGWLLGPMFAGIVASGMAGRPRPLPSGYMTVGQAVLGLVSGVGFPLATLKVAATHAVPLLMVVLITGALSMCVGYLLCRWAGVDRATGFMGALPGAAHSMVAMSDELGADPVAVAVLQYLRLLMVMFLAPVAAVWFFPTGHAAATTVGGLPDAPLATDLAILAACGLAGVWGGLRVKLPSASFLGPMVAALAVSWLVPWQFHMPPVLFNGGMMLVGLSVGARFDVPTARKLGKAALIEAVAVLGLIGMNLGMGYLFHLLTGIDTMTAVLGSTPGGMDTMVAAAVKLGGDPGLVVAMQMARWFTVLLLGPWVTVRLVRGRAPAVSPD